MYLNLLENLSYWYLYPLSNTAYEDEDRASKNEITFVV